MFTSAQISSLDVRSKQRLSSFRKGLMRDWDNRNYDEDIKEVIQKYIRRGWAAEFNRTDRYLMTLKSSKDGKLFSQGVKEYSKLLESARGFAEPNHTYFGWNQNYQRAYWQIHAELVKLKLTPLNYTEDADIVNALPKRDTHAGFTYILTGIKEKGGNLEDIFNRFVALMDDAIEEGSFNSPIMPGVRTQGNGHAFEEDGTFTNDCDHKTRMVAMIDLIVIIAELMFASPFQDFMADADWYAGGKELGLGVGRIVSNWRYIYPYWTSLDYSKFDQSISAWLIHDAFSLIKAAFVQLTPYQEAVFEVIEHDFIEKDFILGEEIIHSVKGVPSGSMWTQIIDSLVNRLMILTYFNAKGHQGKMIIMGDDNLVFTKDRIDPIDLSSYLAKNFGVIVNPDKTQYGMRKDHPHFLSVYWTAFGRWREPHEIFSKMLYPERKRRYYPETETTPEETFWAYCLAYPVSMASVFNIPQFKLDHPNLCKKSLKELSSSSAPGVIRYLANYTGGYWSARG